MYMYHGMSHYDSQRHSHLSSQGLYWQCTERPFCSR
jgi:hypothetical protein